MNAVAQTPTTQKTDDERKALLARAVSDRVGSGWRVESQMDYQAVVAKGHKHSHGLHLFLTIITAGLWGLFVWLPLSVFGGEKRAVLNIDPYGNLRVTK
jgi:hypothetical protein